MRPSFLLGDRAPLTKPCGLCGISRGPPNVVVASAAPLALWASFPGAIYVLRTLLFRSCRCRRLLLVATFSFARSSEERSVGCHCSATRALTIAVPGRSCVLGSIADGARSDSTVLCCPFTVCVSAQLGGPWDPSGGTPLCLVRGLAHAAERRAPPSIIAMLPHSSCSSGGFSVGLHLPRPCSVGAGLYIRRRHRRDRAPRRCPTVLALRLLGV